jgi:Transposase
MARERRLFSEEFKREAVKLVNQPGASKAAIARDLGLGANLSSRWCGTPVVRVRQAMAVSRRCQARNTSACAVNWRKSGRSATS